MDSVIKCCSGVPSVNCQGLQIGVGVSCEDPHSIKSPLHCGYVPLISSLRGEKDPPKKEDCRRMVSLRNRYPLDILYLIP